MIRNYAVFCIFALITFSISNDVLAGDPAMDNVLINCTITPTLNNRQFYPGNDIGRTNNLRRKTGIATVAKGEPIYITGHVVDENCIPIPDATVEMWQANAFGKYHHKNDKSDKLLDENFTGSGKIRTDNLGRYSFITILPGGRTESTAPRLHLSVNKYGFKTITTDMYFPEQAANFLDDELKKNKQKTEALTATRNFEVKDGKYKVERIEGDMVYHFNITMKGKQSLKRY